MTRFAFRGRTAVITGAASGIGAALARDLHERGCLLALIDRDASALEELAVRLGSGRVSQYVCDLGDGDAASKVSAELAATYPRIDMLINNAGIAAMGRFDQTSLDEFERVLRVNFWAPVAMTKQLSNLLSGDARIVNMSSIFGIAAPAGQVPYAASKFALRGFSEALRHELADTGIKVITVHPGGVRTAIARNAEISRTIDPISASAAQTDFGRLLKLDPDHVARQITKAIARGAPRLLIGTDARAGDLLVRLLPGRYGAVLSRLMGGLRHHVGTPATGAAKA